jgi:hypothetical protein
MTKTVFLGANRFVSAEIRFRCGTHSFGTIKFGSWDYFRDWNPGVHPHIRRSKSCELTLRCLVALVTECADCSGRPLCLKRPTVNSLKESDTMKVSTQLEDF